MLLNIDAVVDKTPEFYHIFNCTILSWRHLVAWARC